MMCRYCKETYYVKRLRVLKPIMAPLTHEQAHEQALSYELVECENTFCPMCGESSSDPKPLILKELSELNNHPVWIVDLITGRLSGWDVREESLDDEYYIGFKGQSRHRNEYGDFWLAYDRKPKKGLI